MLLWLLDPGKIGKHSIKLFHRWNPQHSWVRQTTITLVGIFPHKLKFLYSSLKIFFWLSISLKQKITKEVCFAGNSRRFIIKIFDIATDFMRLPKRISFEPSVRYILTRRLKFRSWDLIAHGSGIIMAIRSIKSFGDTVVAARCQSSMVDLATANRFSRVFHQSLVQGYLWVDSTYPPFQAMQRPQWMLSRRPPPASEYAVLRLRQRRPSHSRFTRMMDFLPQS